MKKLLLLAALLLCGASAFCQGLQWGPWVTETRENSLSILWVSEQPGMAWAELENGTRIWETFAGRRIFRRLHKIHLEGLEPGAELRYRVGGENLLDDSHPKDPKFGTSYSGDWQKVKTFDAEAPACYAQLVRTVFQRARNRKRLDRQRSEIPDIDVYTSANGNAKRVVLVPALGLISVATHRGGHDRMLRLVELVS